MLLLCSIALILGIMVGSFINVVVYRLAQALLDDNYHDNIIMPASYCPHCKTPLRWYHLLPILSFLLLRGRCGFCRHPIAWQYPLVEATCGIASAMAVYLFYPHLLACIAGVLFCWLTIALFVIDLKYQLLPDTLTYLLLWIGLGFSLANTFISPYSAIAGVITAFVIFWLIQWIFAVLAKKPGLGGGDVKLFAALGAWLGWQSLFQLMALSGILALLTVGSLILIRKHHPKDYFPFGPFIIAAGWTMMVATYH
jgi:leader peptidase (prepilin peptidase)/N-methyltransferase